MMLILNILSLYVAFALAVEEFVCVNCETSVDMLEQGKQQYQLLKERGQLPKYGTCWKQAIEHIENGCRYLSEDTQSEVALYLTNCFLEMSGHEIYNCVHDKKPNLRAICINSMTDRAFNVYTEFYTHTQNICWFLRGQVWHETVIENTRKVGKQMEMSAKNQEQLLVNQAQTLEMQEKIIKYGNDLEEIMKGFLISAEQHRELLGIIKDSLNTLQSWLMGEISWIDTIVFYLTSLFFIIFITANAKTSTARLPIFILLALSLLFERLMCKYYSSDVLYDISHVHASYYTHIWYFRYVFLFLIGIFLCLSVYFYRDYVNENNVLLHKLHEQLSLVIKDIKCQSTQNTSNGHIEYIKEKCSREQTPHLHDSSLYRENNVFSPKVNNKGRSKKKLIPDLLEQGDIKYNLRSRQGTPDSSFSRII